MAFQWVDRVKVSTSTTGAGSPLSLGSAVSGFRDFSVVTSGNQVYYAIEDGSAWEVCYGTFTSGSPGTLTRTTLDSSTGSALSLSGSAVLYVTITADAMVNNFAIQSGTINGVTIGGVNPAPGTFTSGGYSTSFAYGSNTATGDGTVFGFTFNSAANIYRIFEFQTAGILRWQLGVDVNDNLYANAFSATGAYAFSPFSINVSSGVVTIPNILTGGGFINSTPVGAGGASTGAFTTLSANAGGTFSGTATYTISAPFIVSGAATLSSSLTSSSTTATSSFAGILNCSGWLSETNVASTVAAAGSTLAAATLLTAQYNIVTSSTASTAIGVKLNTANMTLGTIVTVINATANTINVYPNTSSGTISLGSAGAASTLATGTAGNYMYVSSTKWYRVASG